MARTITIFSSLWLTFGASACALGMLPEGDDAGDTRRGRLGDVGIGGAVVDLDLRVDPAIDPDRVLVPPLIVQPYAENAIWHGLMHKIGDRKLTINVSRENGALHITVRDNGIGREASRALNAMSARKHRSLGMSITKEVIARSGPGAGVMVKDLKDSNDRPAGTEVHIRIPYRTS